MNNPSDILPERTMLGRNRIQRFLWSSPLGSVYEITIGSTTHEYGLLVLHPSVSIDLATLQQVLHPVIAANDPCLAKPYACGEDDGRRWIRMELTEAVRFSRFDSSRRHGPSVDEEDEEEEDIRVEDAQELLEAFGGPIPQTTLGPILSDLVEGMAAVHAAGGILGPLTLRDIGFCAWIRHTGFPVIAKWCNYGLLRLSKPDTIWTQQNDIRMFARLLPSLLCGQGSDTLPDNAWPEWPEFVSKAGDNGFANAEALSKALRDLLAAHGIAEPPRIRPEDAVSPTAAVAETDAHPLRHRTAENAAERRNHRARRRRERAPKITRKSALLTLAVILVAGFAFHSANPRPFRKLGHFLASSFRLLTDTPADHPGAAETNDVANASSSKIGSDADLWILPFETIKQAAEDTTNLPVRMRYAFALAEGDSEEGREPDPDLAAAIASEAFQAMENHEVGVDLALDRACDFWMGYALLTGLGVEQDTARGVLLLSRAEDVHNDRYAKSLLADYYASGAEGGHTAANDAAALKRWFELLEKDGTGAGRLTFDGYRCADKVAAFYFAGRAIPDHEQDHYIAHLEAIARRRHLPTVLALGRIYLEGKITGLDESAAKRWYTDAAQTGNAEGMYHMGWLIERGIAAVSDDHAAAIWYRRAAQAGHAEAMRSLARLLRENRLKNDNGDILTSDAGKTADEWEAAAKTEAKLPPYLPYTTWWLGRQATRFPGPDPVRAE